MRPGPRSSPAASRCGRPATPRPPANPGRPAASSRTRDRGADPDSDLRGVVVRIRVQLDAAAERISLQRDGTLRAWVRVGAHEGLANRRLQVLLARLCGLERDAIEILAGARTPWKLVRIPGLSRLQLRNRIPARRGGYRFDALTARRIRRAPRARRTSRSRSPGERSS